MPHIYIHVTLASHFWYWFLWLFGYDLSFCNRHCTKTLWPSEDRSLSLSYVLFLFKANRWFRKDRRFEWCSFLLFDRSWIFCCAVILCMVEVASVPDVCVPACGKHMTQKSHVTIPLVVHWLELYLDHF